MTHTQTALYPVQVSGNRPMRGVSGAYRQDSKWLTRE